MLAQAGRENISLSCKMDDGVRPPSVVGGTSRRTGGARRQAKNALPSPFFIVCQSRSMIIGACLFIECCDAVDEEEVIWTATRFVEFTTHEHIGFRDSRYRSLVFKLRCEVERRIRVAPVQVGGTLHDHFVDFAAMAWRCMLLKADACCLLMSSLHGTCRVPTSRVVRRLAGVAPYALHR